MEFTCPDLHTVARTPANWSTNISIGSSSMWGGLATFTARSDDLGDDHLGNTKRNAVLTNQTGSFGIKCISCGMGILKPQDTDGRDGFFETEIEYGPNIFDGRVKESEINGYRIYLVNSCGERIGRMLKWMPSMQDNNEGDPVNSICDCKTWKYKTQLNFEFPKTGGPFRIMVVPNLKSMSEYEVTTGVTTEDITDAYTTTSTYTSTTSSTFTTTSTTPTTTTTTTTTSTITTTSTQTLPPRVLPEGGVRDIAGFYEALIDCNEADSYIADYRARTSYQQSIAKMVGVAANLVSVVLRSMCGGRRLEGVMDERRLQEGRVRISYIIRVAADTGLIFGKPPITSIYDQLTSPSALPYLTRQVKFEYENVEGQGSYSNKYTATVAVASTPGVTVVTTTPWPSWNPAPAPPPPRQPKPTDAPNDVSVTAIAVSVGGLGLLGGICCAVNFVISRRQARADPQTQI